MKITPEIVIAYELLLLWCLFGQLRDINHTRKKERPATETERHNHLGSTTEQIAESESEFIAAWPTGKYRKFC